MNAQIYRERFSFAHYVDLEIQKATRLAEIRFADKDGDAFAVTIPLGELKRLYDEVTRRKEKEPDLFAHESRTQT